MTGNRMRAMVTISDMLRAQGKSELANVFALVSMYPPERERDYVLPPADNTQFLLVKPDGFTGQDIARMKAAVAARDLNFIYYAGQPASEGNVVRDLMADADAQGSLNAVLWRYGAAAYAASDDRPFAADPFPLAAYTTADFWLGRQNEDFPARINRIWRLRLFHVIGVAGIIVASFVLILVPLLISYRRRTIARTAGTANHIFYFACLGAAFMFVEMGFIQKLRLLVGHPGHTIAIVLASVILFTGIGSFLSTRLFAGGLLTFRRAALAAALAIVATLVLTEALMPEMVGLPRALKLALAFVIPAEPALLMGQLFPQGLAALTHSERLIPLAMGVNAMTGTIAAGLGVALAPIIGFHAIILLGGFIYCVIAGMPHRVRSEQVARRSAAAALS
ncbi:MAG: hypothetical protein ACE5DS_10435 [Kiloniellaceae bacterium]